MKTEKWNGIITSASEAVNSNKAFYQSVYRFDPLCIPFRGNIPLRGNAVCILFISSERVEIFYLNFAALIQVSIETFWDPYI